MIASGDRSLDHTLDFRGVTSDGPTVPMTSLVGLFDLTQTDRISLLKVDIEGSEHDVFEHADPVTLSQVRPNRDRVPRQHPTGDPRPAQGPFGVDPPLHHAGFRNRGLRYSLSCPKIGRACLLKDGRHSDPIAQGPFTKVAQRSNRSRANRPRAVAASTKLLPFIACRWLQNRGYPKIDRFKYDIGYGDAARLSLTLNIYTHEYITEDNHGGNNCNAYRDGAAGFIGSNVVRGLNERGVRDILAVDDLKHGDKFLNLRDCEIADFMDKREFREAIRRGAPGLEAQRRAAPGGLRRHDRVERPLHDGEQLHLLEGALALGARPQDPVRLRLECVGLRRGEAVHRDAGMRGAAQRLRLSRKLLFDRYVRRRLPSVKSTVVGLRYFNVYGPGEQHKGRMASMVYQLYDQLKHTGVARLFDGTDGYAAGEQRRDFIYVGDVVAINLFFAEGKARQGVFNVGTGTSRSFNDIARTLIALLGRGQIEYIPFPESLRGKYQSFTESDISRLRAAGYDRPFTSLEQGIGRLCDLRGS